MRTPGRTTGITRRTACQKAALRWNQFGGVIGGPIKKDKLFFFADYQGQRLDYPTSLGTTSVMTAAERGGDFSAMLQASTPYPITNPFASNAPFPGNQVPLTMIDPAAKNLFASGFYPLPNATGTNNGLEQQFSLWSELGHQSGSGRCQDRL